MARVDEIGPWSREKLNLLGDYLKSYTSILNTQRKNTENPRGWLQKIHYIDAFAGSVTPLDREAQQYIDGSPLVAIKTHPEFDSYIFIEKNQKRIDENILPIKEQFPDKDIQILHGDCNDMLCNIILPRFPVRAPERGFIFLDPYGLELDWSTVSAIGKSKIFDVFINFSVMGVYRQLGNKPPTPKYIKRINNMMGCEEWLAEAYQPSQQLTLLDMSPPIERQGYKLAERLSEFYRKRIQTCFEHVSRSVMMCNKSGGPLYSLILASQQKLAVTKMHEIFDRRERNVRKKKKEHP